MREEERRDEERKGGKAREGETTGEKGREGEQGGEASGGPLPQQRITHFKNSSSRIHAHTASLV